MKLTGYIAWFDEDDHDEESDYFDRETAYEFFLYPLSEHVAIRKNNDFIDLFHSSKKLGNYDVQKYTITKQNCYDIILLIFLESNFLREHL